MINVSEYEKQAEKYAEYIRKHYKEMPEFECAKAYYNEETKTLHLKFEDGEDVNLFPAEIKAETNSDLQFMQFGHNENGKLEKSWFASKTYEKTINNTSYQISTTVEHYANYNKNQVTITQKNKNGIGLSPSYETTNGKDIVLKGLVIKNDNAVMQMYNDRSIYIKENNGHEYDIQLWKNNDKIRGIKYADKNENALISKLSMYVNTTLEESGYSSIDYEITKKENNKYTTESYHVLDNKIQSMKEPIIEYLFVNNHERTLTCENPNTNKSVYKTVEDNNNENKNKWEKIITCEEYTYNRNHEVMETRYLQYYGRDANSESPVEEYDRKEQIITDVKISLSDDNIYSIHVDNKTDKTKGNMYLEVDAATLNIKNKRLNTIYTSNSVENYCHTEMQAAIKEYEKKELTGRGYSTKEKRELKTQFKDNNYENIERKYLETFVKKAVSYFKQSQEEFNPTIKLEAIPGLKMKM